MLPSFTFLLAGRLCGGSDKVWFWHYRPRETFSVALFSRSNLFFLSHRFSLRLSSGTVLSPPPCVFLVLHSHEPLFFLAIFVVRSDEFFVRLGGLVNVLERFVP